MPRHFTDEERTKIVDMLMNTGFDHFTRYGIRGTRIDDICREVGIAKGSFYQFFPSKEELFMVIAEQHDERHRRDISKLAETHQGTSEAFVSNLYDHMISALETDPLMATISQPGAFEHLIRKLPPERIMEHRDRDAAYFVDKSPDWLKKGLIKDVPGTLLNELLIPVICVIMRRDALPEQEYRNSIDHLKTLFIHQLAKV